MRAFRKHLWVACLFLAGPVCGEADRLSSTVRPGQPWLPFEANSEQMQPFAVGASARDFVLTGKREKIPRLYPWMKKLAETQARALAAKLGKKQVVFEVWPAYSEHGDPTWVFARWKAPAGAWAWIELAAQEEPSATAPYLPLLLRSSVPQDQAKLFEDYSGYGSLYAKPAFASGVWVSESQKTVLEAWPAFSSGGYLRSRSKGKEKWLVYVLPPPSRLEEKPITFALQVGLKSVRWLDPIHWDRPSFQDGGRAVSLPKLAFDSTFSKKIRKQVDVLTGATEAIFPISRRKEKFLRKNPAQPDHQLEQVVNYLAEQYQTLGVNYRRETFDWGDKHFSNLIAVLPGSLTADQNRPVLLADHFDTAFCETTFYLQGERVSTPGASDNGVATAILLQAPEVLKGIQPKHDIWLVHFTGEEFPADSLGARHFFPNLLEKKQPIGGLVLLDLIGHRLENEKFFQLNPGNTPESLDLTATAVAASGRLKLPFKATIRPRFNLKSYLFNTDGWIADMLGFPVLYFSEHVHRHNMEEKSHYHQCSDRPDNVDWDYALSIAKVALLTTAAYASQAVSAPPRDIAVK